MFDEENLQEGYKCECGGSITLYDGIWYCDKCDFEAPDSRNMPKSAYGLPCHGCDSTAGICDCNSR